MPPGVLRILRLAALLLLLPGLALAHVTSTGAAVLDVDGNRLDYKLTLNAEEVDPLYVPILLSAGKREPVDVARVEKALRDYARFAIDGESCQPESTRVRASEGKLLLELSLSCSRSAGTLWMRDDWPEVMGAHFQTVLTVNVAKRVAGQLVFLDARREATLELHAPVATDWASFVLMGAEHILGGADHLLFLIALLALSRRLWSTVKIVTCFTVGHSVTLSLATLGWVEVPSSIVEPLIAASIIWVALENILSPHSEGRRPLVAIFFGLVHGLGFAGALLEIGLPHEALIRALIGFNIGVELAQILFVALVLPAIVWASRPGRLARLPQAMSIGAAVAGVTWLLQRVFFSP